MFLIILIFVRISTNSFAKNANMFNLLFKQIFLIKVIATLSALYTKTLLKHIVVRDLIVQKLKAYRFKGKNVHFTMKKVFVD